MRILAASAFLILAGGAARAQATTGSTVTLLATGTVASMYGYPVGTLSDGYSPKIGDTMQIEYTVDPLLPPPQVPNLGPVVALSYSFNGLPFVSDVGYGNMGVSTGSGYNFTLYPGNGAEAELSIRLGPGAPAGIIPSSALNTIPNFALAAGAPPGSVNASMLVYDVSGSGAYANITSIKEVGAVAAAPEIDPAGLAGGLTLLLGGIAVLRGRRKSFQYQSTKRAA